jgi:hypothetical protein
VKGRRRAAPAAPDPFAYGLFAWQAGWVFALRSAALWAEPAKAQAKLTEYALEKQKAFAAGALDAGAAVMTGATPAAVAAAALAPSRRRVRANARKLAKGG